MKVSISNSFGRLREAIIGGLPSINFIEGETGIKVSDPMKKIYHDVLKDIDALCELLEAHGVKTHKAEGETFDEFLRVSCCLFPIDDRVLVTMPSKPLEGLGLENMISTNTEKSFFNMANHLFTKDQLVIGYEKNKWHIDALTEPSLIGDRSKIINPMLAFDQTGIVSPEICVSYRQHIDFKKIFRMKHTIDLKEIYADHESDHGRWISFASRKEERCLGFQDDVKLRNSMGRYFLSGGHLDLLKVYSDQLVDLFSHKLFDGRFIRLDSKTIISSTRNHKVIESFNRHGIDVIHTNWRHRVMIDCGLNEIVTPIVRDNEG